MNKHDECSHTISLSGKLLYCFQMVYCGNQDYLIVKTTDSNLVIYANVISNGYTFFNNFDIHWEYDENGDDVLVYDITYSFKNYGENKIALIDAEEIEYELANSEYNSYTLFAKKEDIFLEHRLIKYKRDANKKDLQNYEPHGHKTEFNREMVIIDDIKGELFKKWKEQDKCIIYLIDSPDNKQHPNHANWLNSKNYGMNDYTWFFSTTDW